MQPTQYESRAYQREASEYISRRRKAFLIAPAGSGKTVIMAQAVAMVLERRDPTKPCLVGWLCGTHDQKLQAQKALEAFPIIANQASYTVTCDPVRADFSTCDLLIVDEAAHARTAPTWKAAIATCKGALWGMSATPWGDDEDANEELRQLFGGNFYEISRSHVGDKLTDAQVIFLQDTDLDIADEIDTAIEKTMKWRRKFWKDDEMKLWGQIAWQECMKRGIVGNRARTLAAIDTAKKHDKESVLLLISQIEHGADIQKRIPFSELCHSKIGKRARDRMIDRFRSGETPCLVASSLADEGFDAPIASTLILVSGGKSEARTIQRAGRVCRKYEGKSMATIYDFSDNWHPLAAKHARRRMEVYQTLGYTIK